MATTYNTVNGCLVITSDADGDIDLSALRFPGLDNAMDAAQAAALVTAINTAQADVIAVIGRENATANSPAVLTLVSQLVTPVRQMAADMVILARQLARVTELYSENYQAIP